MRRSKTARCSAEVTTCSIVPRRFAARAVLRARPTRRARSPGRSPWPAGRRRVPALAQGHAATREFGSHHHVDAHRATLRRDRRPHARTYGLRAGGSRQRYRGTRASHRRPIAANGRPRRSQSARGGHRAHSLSEEYPGLRTDEEFANRRETVSLVEQRIENRSTSLHESNASPDAIDAPTAGFSSATAARPRLRTFDAPANERRVILQGR